MRRFVVVLGPFSSGSTAVSGILDRLGAYSCPPHFETSDPNTPNAFEPVVLREILLRHIDENVLRFQGNGLNMAKEMAEWLRTTLPEGPESNVVSIKHPLLMLVVPYLLPLLRPRLILVRRPYADIDRTRIRRRWYPHYGAMGARLLYDKALSDLAAHDLQYLDVFYPDLLANPDREVGRIARYAGLQSDDRHADAVRFITDSAAARSAQPST